MKITIKTRFNIGAQVRNAEGNKGIISGVKPICFIGQDTVLEVHYTVVFDYGPREVSEADITEIA